MFFLSRCNGFNGGMILICGGSYDSFRVLGCFDMWFRILDMLNFGVVSFLVVCADLSALVTLCSCCFYNFIKIHVLCRQENFLWSQTRYIFAHHPKVVVRIIVR